jgi:hypothetical protein
MYDYYNDNNDKDKKKKSKRGDDKFNKKAYKHAISMVESSGGKFLESAIDPKTGEPYSSAAGNYHFLYESILNDPDMEGISKREFINRPDLQEKIMEKALNGTLKGYSAYGEKYSNKLKKEFNSDHSVNEIAAMVHFVGSGATRRYLRDPENFAPPGKNMSSNKYLQRFNENFEKYILENKVEEMPQVEEGVSQGQPATLPTPPNFRNDQVLTQPKDNIKLNVRDLANMVSNNKSSAPNYEGDPEMLFKEKYNTKLTEEEKTKYNAWVNSESKRQGRDITMDLGAYDIQGFWKSGDHMNMDGDNHGSDRWKKPNHPTFSNESNYHNVDGYSGGTWAEDGGYTPSDFTNSLYDESYYKRMFGREPHRPEYLKIKKQANNFKQGGQIHSNQGDANGLVTKFENGGLHEENPLGGIPLGIGPNGKPNLVEEGETKWNDYIFSNVYDMDGNYTGGEGKKENVFKKGGCLKTNKLKEGGELQKPVKKQDSSFLDSIFIPKK